MLASESVTKTASEAGSHDSSPDKSAQEFLSPEPSSQKSKTSNPNPSVAERLRQRKRSSQAIVPFEPQSSKKAKPSSLSALTFSKRKILKPLIIGHEFWTQELSEEDEELYGEALDELHSLLQFQGWDKMLCEPFSASEDAVRMFYEAMQFVPQAENSPCNDAILLWKGTSLPLTAKLIASALGIESRSGFDVLPLKKGWPKGKGFKEKGAILRKIYDGDSPDTMLTKDLSIANKLLHFWITRNLVPRQEHRNEVLISDAIFMDKILNGVQLDLPRIVLAHMQYCAGHDTHALPFPNVIKKFLASLNQYPGDLPETEYSHCLTMKIVRTLKSKEQKPSPAAIEELPPKGKASSQGRSSSHPQKPPSTDSSAIPLGLDRIEKAILDGLTANAVATNNLVKEMGKISSSVESLAEVLKKEWNAAIGANQATGQNVGSDQEEEEEATAVI